MSLEDQMISVHSIASLTGKVILIPLYELRGRLSLRRLRFIGDSDGAIEARWGFALYRIVNEPGSTYDPLIVQSVEFQKHYDLGVVATLDDTTRPHDLVLKTPIAIDSREGLWFLGWTTNTETSRIFCPISGAMAEQLDCGGLMTEPAGTPEAMPERVRWSQGIAGGAGGDYATRSVPAISLRDNLSAMLTSNL